MSIARESANSDPITATSDTSMDVTAPTGIAAGDLLVGFGGCSNARTIAPPAGWTERANDTGTGGTDPRVYVWTKTADSTDAAASTFTFTVSGTSAASIVAVHRVSGANTSNAPTTGFGLGANSQTQTAPTIVTPSANCLVFWGVFRSGTSTATADKGTERVDNSNANGGFMANYTNLEATAGSITGAVITTSAFGAKRVFSVAIESAGGGGGSVGMVNPMPRRQARNKALNRM